MVDARLIDRARRGPKAMGWVVDRCRAKIEKQLTCRTARDHGANGASTSGEIKLKEHSSFARHFEQVPGRDGTPIRSDASEEQLVPVWLARSVNRNDGLEITCQPLFTQHVH